MLSEYEKSIIDFLSEKGLSYQEIAQRISESRACDMFTFLCGEIEAYIKEGI